MRRQIRRLACLAGALLLLVVATPAHAQNSGFQVNRFEPTAAGEWSLWVDHPWYSQTRYFAGGITLNYGRQPLVFGYIDPSGQFNASSNAIAHQLVGHLDLAGSFADRVLITLSLPITLLERGEASGGVTPLEGIAAGDPRLGFLVRLYGQPYAGKFSVSVGGLLWLPLRRFDDGFAATESDQEFRGLPKIVLGGLASRVLWSATLGFLIRPEATIGNLTNPAGRTAGSELQVGFGIGYANKEARFAIGPELIFATSLSGNAFQFSYSSLEALLGIHYNIARLVQVSLGGGVGVLRQPGTPDSRFLLRVAYSPVLTPTPKDRDRDGVADAQDICPDEPKGDHPDSDKLGCPLRDRDGDGVFDNEDQCLDTVAGAHPDPEKPGCPEGDRDHDGVLDREDFCPDEPQGSHPSPQKLGCPQRDRDGDGIADGEDQCPDTAKGAHPDPARTGCPASDRDHDGIFEPEDLCPDVPSGDYPDPAKRGCPLPDRDRDTIPDGTDACPDEPGAPSTDAKRHGCPGLVIVKGGIIVILKPIQFANNKATILKKSFPVLEAVVDVLKVVPQIKKLRIEGHTDNRGKDAHNLDLSNRRADSVLQWLVGHGSEPGRLEAQGFGSKRPVADNATADGRATNRRIDFVIADPPQAGAGQSAPVVEQRPAGSSDKTGVIVSPDVASVEPPPSGTKDQSLAPAEPGEKPEKPGRRSHHRKHKSHHSAAEK